MSADQHLLATLSAITGTGNFHATGAEPYFMPELHINGVGEVAFPLIPAQAREIIARAEAAPFGRGNRTIYDESVRKCWQLAAADFTFGAKAWKSFLKRALDHIAETLGIRGKISAHPYKFLLYGPGGHFKAHRDTEKLDAMFGTLVIALPSKHEGGQLHIRHDGREHTVDFGNPEHARNIQFAAFFADCEHEVVPVTAGYRCCAIYNLRLDEGDPALLNLSLTEHSRALLAPLAALRREVDRDLRAVVLEHSYTEANLSLRRLKGNDQARAQALLAAAAQAGFTAHLALLTFHQSGELVEHDYRRGRRGRRYWDGDDDDSGDVDGTMGEIYDESLTLSDWRDPRDRKRALGSYHISSDDLVAPADFSDLEPDEKEAEGYTGNAGCTMDHWYRRAAIVLWRDDQDEAILCHYDIRGAMAMLSKLAATKKTAPRSPFHRLASAALEACPEKFRMPGYYREDEEDLRTDREDPLLALIAAVATSGAPDLLEMLIARLPAEGWLAVTKPMWDAMHRAFGVAAFHPVREALLAEKAGAGRVSLYRTLESLAGQADAGDAIRRIAPGLLALGLREPDSRRAWQRDPRDPDPPPGDRAEARATLAASPHFTAAKLRQAARAFLEGDSSLAYVRSVLGPALLEKSVAAALKQGNSLVPELVDHAIAILEREVARPLPPYPDWRRPCPKPARAVSHLQTRAPADGPLAELAAFMADPAAKEHTFARRQDERSQIEGYVKTHRLDLTCVTLAKGSPHKLVCTKTDASHHHALARRGEDAELLAMLKRLKPSAR
jgi:hypothetical protein